jgi:lipoate-protein ligase A
MPSLRLLPRRDDDGPGNMALDEALLEQAAVPTLRLYGWSPPAVSLGYFQDFASIHDRLPAGMPIVRRITGGGAIWHEHEVTYCLVADAAHGLLPDRSEDLYCRLHRAVMAAVQARGRRLDEQAATVGDRRYRDEPRCFASPAAHDLVAVGGGKVLGSAARQRGGRTLIHGSLKLASNAWDGAVTAGCGLDADAAATALMDGIAAAFGCDLEPGDLTDAERAAQARLRDVRYGTPDWVRLRSGPRP